MREGWLELLWQSICQHFDLYLHCDWNLFVNIRCPQTFVPIVIFTHNTGHSNTIGAFISTNEQFRSIRIWGVFELKFLQNTIYELHQNWGSVDFEWKHMVLPPPRKEREREFHLYLLIFAVYASVHFSSFVFFPEK